MLLRTLIGALLGSLSLAACGAGGHGRPPIVLIVVDTLRADHLGSYGHDRDTSPNIDALAARATLYRNALSTAPWTSPAVAAMLTGRQPAQLGILGGPIVLDRRVPRVPERLADVGYISAGVISHLYLGRKFNYDQGFYLWDQRQAKGHTEVSSRWVSDSAIASLRELRKTGQPLFLFVHYFDPHYDYIQHDGFDYSGGYSGNVRSQMDNSDELRELAKHGQLTPADLAYLRASYDSEISYTDEQIGRLLDELERLGSYDEALIVLTADHGEAFAERKEALIGHTSNVHQECLHVPLIVKWPRQTRGRVVEEDVSTLDVAPTLLVAAGLDPTEGGWMAGEPLDRPRAGRPIFAQTRRRARRDVVVRDGWKLLHDRTVDVRALYDLRSDPGERTNRVNDEVERAAELGALLDAWRTEMDRAAESAAGSEPAYTRDETRLLRALGYGD